MGFRMFLSRHQTGLGFHFASSPPLRGVIMRKTLSYKLTNLWFQIETTRFVFLFAEGHPRERILRDR